MERKMLAYPTVQGIRGSVIGLFSGAVFGAGEGAVAQPPAGQTLTHLRRMKPPTGITASTSPALCQPLLSQHLKAWPRRPKTNAPFAAGEKCIFRVLQGDDNLVTEG